MSNPELTARTGAAVKSPDAPAVEVRSPQPTKSELETLLHEKGRALAEERGKILGLGRPEELNEWYGEELKRIDRELVEVKRAFEGSSYLQEHAESVLQRYEDRARLDVLSLWMAKHARDLAEAKEFHPGSVANHEKYFQEFMASQQEFLERYKGVREELIRHRDDVQKQVHASADKAREAAAGAHAGLDAWTSAPFEDAIKPLNYMERRYMNIAYEQLYGEKLRDAIDRKTWFSATTRHGIAGGVGAEISTPARALSETQLDRYLSIEKLRTETKAVLSENALNVTVAKLALSVGSDDPFVGAILALKGRSADARKLILEEYKTRHGVDYLEAVKSKVHDVELKVIQTLISTGELTSGPTDKDLAVAVAERVIRIGRQEGELLADGHAPGSAAVKELNQRFTRTLSLFFGDNPNVVAGMTALHDESLQGGRMERLTRKVFELEFERAKEHATPDGLADEKKLKSLNERLDAVLNAHKEFLEKHPDFKKDLESKRDEAQRLGERVMRDAERSTVDLYNGIHTVWGTLEDKIYKALEGKDALVRKEIIELYRKRYKVNLRAEIEGDFSGAELDKAIALYEGEAGKALAAQACIDMTSWFGYWPSRTSLEKTLEARNLLPDAERKKFDDTYQEKYVTVIGDMLDRRQLTYNVAIGVQTTGAVTPALGAAPKPKSMEECIQALYGGDGQKVLVGLYRKDEDLVAAARLHEKFGVIDDERGAAVQIEKFVGTADLSIDESKVKALISRYEKEYSETLDSRLSYEMVGPSRNWSRTLLGLDEASKDMSLVDRRARAGAHRLLFSTRETWVSTHQDLLQEMFEISKEQQRKPEGDQTRLEAVARQQLYNERVMTQLRELDVDGRSELRRTMNDAHAAAMLQRVDRGYLRDGEAIVEASGRWWDGTNEAQLHERLDGKTKEDVARIEREIREFTEANKLTSYDGYSLQDIIAWETSGTEQFDLQEAARGLPETREEMLAYAKRRRDFEASGWINNRFVQAGLMNVVVPGGVVVPLVHKFDPLGIDELDRRIAELEKFEKEHPEKTPENDRKFRAMFHAFKSQSDVVRETKDGISDAATFVATTGAVIVVGIATAGQALYIIIPAVAATSLAASAGTKYLIRGDGYGSEELAVDVGLAGIDGVTVGTASYYAPGLAKLAGGYFTNPAAQKFVYYLVDAGIQGGVSEFVAGGARSFILQDTNGKTLEEIIAQALQDATVSSATGFVMSAGFSGLKEGYVSIRGEAEVHLPARAQSEPHGVTALDAPDGNFTIEARVPSDGPDLHVETTDPTKSVPREAVLVPAAAAGVVDGPNGVVEVGGGSRSSTGGSVAEPDAIAVGPEQSGGVETAGANGPVDLQTSINAVAPSADVEALARQVELEAAKRRAAALAVAEKLRAEEAVASATGSEIASPSLDASGRPVAAVPVDSVSTNLETSVPDGVVRPSADAPELLAADAGDGTGAVIVEPASESLGPPVDASATGPEGTGTRQNAVATGDPELYSRLDAISPGGDMEELARAVELERMRRAALQSASTQTDILAGAADTTGVPGSMSFDTGVIDAAAPVGAAGAAGTRPATRTTTKAPTTRAATTPVAPATPPEVKTAPAAPTPPVAPTTPPAPAGGGAPDTKKTAAKTTAAKANAPETAPAPADPVTPAAGTKVAPTKAPARASANEISEAAGLLGAPVDSGSSPRFFEAELDYLHKQRVAALGPNPAPAEIAALDEALKKLKSSTHMVDPGRAPRNPAKAFEGDLRRARGALGYEGEGQLPNRKDIHAKRDSLLAGIPDDGTPQNTRRRVEIEAAADFLASLADKEKPTRWPRQPQDRTPMLDRLRANRWAEANVAPENVRNVEQYRTDRSQALKDLGFDPRKDFPDPSRVDSQLEWLLNDSPNRFDPEARQRARAAAAFLKDVHAKVGADGRVGSTVPEMRNLGGQRAALTPETFDYNGLHRDVSDARTRLGIQPGEKVDAKQARARAEAKIKADPANTGSYLAAYELYADYVLRKASPDKIPFLSKLDAKWTNEMRSRAILSIESSSALGDPEILPNELEYRYQQATANRGQADILPDAEAKLVEAEALSDAAAKRRADLEAEYQTARADAGTDQAKLGEVEKKYTKLIEDATKEADRLGAAADMEQARRDVARADAQRIADVESARNSMRGYEKKPSPAAEDVERAAALLGLDVNDPLPPSDDIRKGITDTDSVQRMKKLRALEYLDSLRSEDSAEWPTAGKAKKARPSLDAFLDRGFEDLTARAACGIAPGVEITADVVGKATESLKSARSASQRARTMAALDHLSEPKEGVRLQERVAAYEAKYKALERLGVDVTTLRNPLMEPVLSDEALGRLYRLQIAQVESGNCPFTRVEVEAAYQTYLDLHPARGNAAPDASAPAQRGFYPNWLGGLRYGLPDFAFEDTRQFFGQLFDLRPDGVLRTTVGDFDVAADIEQRMTRKGRAPKPEITDPNVRPARNVTYEQQLQRQQDARRALGLGADDPINPAAIEQRIGDTSTPATEREHGQHLLRAEVPEGTTAAGTAGVGLRAFLRSWYYPGPLVVGYLSRYFGAPEAVPQIADKVDEYSGVLPLGSKAYNWYTESQRLDREAIEGTTPLVEPQVLPPQDFERPRNDPYSGAPRESGAGSIPELIPPEPVTPAAPVTPRSPIPTRDQIEGTAPGAPREVDPNIRRGADLRFRNPSGRGIAADVPAAALASAIPQDKRERFATLKLGTETKTV